MQYKIFTISVESPSAEVENDLNRFLRSCRLIDVEKHLVVSSQKAFWTYCVQYADIPKNDETAKNIKIDYKNILNEGDFNRFLKLRDIRKHLSQKEAIPAYAVFTDAELAEISKLDTITEKSILKIDGIGKRKSEKFGKDLELLFNQNETTGKPD